MQDPTKKVVSAAVSMDPYYELPCKLPASAEDMFKDSDYLDLQVSAVGGEVLPLRGFDLRPDLWFRTTRKPNPATGPLTETQIIGIVFGCVGFCAGCIRLSGYIARYRKTRRAAATAFPNNPSAPLLVNSTA